MVPVLAMLLNGVLLFLVPPLLILYTTLMILAPFGLSLGVRKKYVQLLLRIFEVSRPGGCGWNEGVVVVGGRGRWEGGGDYERV